VFISCGNLEKENCTDSGSSLLLYENYENTAVPLNLHEKSNVNNGYALTVFSGHTSNDCTGCVMVAGVLVHMDCVGGGGDCTVKASVTLSSSIDSLYNAITLYAYELTDEDIFLMPARSLFAGMNGEKEI
ncbi:hypothetical protein LJC69_05770, partial [Bacteroidales bacterium OttesenSCG-928-K22]|nr:hypothetical protein [Bacteroidales bacterium OttesenSCG-928-K22]